MLVSLINHAFYCIDVCIHQQPGCDYVLGVTLRSRCENITFER